MIWEWAFEETGAPYFNFKEKKVFSLSLCFETVVRLLLMTSQILMEIFFSRFLFGSFVRLRKVLDIILLFFYRKLIEMFALINHQNININLGSGIFKERDFFGNYFVKMNISADHEGSLWLR